MIQGIESVVVDLNKMTQHLPTGIEETQPVGQFDLAWEHAQNEALALEPGKSSAESDGFLKALGSMRSLNGELQSLGVEALIASKDGLALTPKEMLDLNVKAHEFVFQAQITATVASKTSDGISQLFRQQG